MTMTRSAPELAPYRRGDLAKIPCAEPDPVPGWPELAEKEAHDLRSITLGGVLVASFGYMIIASDEAEAFAVVDRERCAGHGKEIVEIIRERQLQWMRDILCRKVCAYSSPGDAAGKAFLRAIGYKRDLIKPGASTRFILEMRY